MKVREAITIAAHVAEKRSALPILAHVLLQEGRVLATDLTQQIEIPVEMPTALTKAGFCVNAARLTRVLKALPDDLELDLKVKNKKLHISAGSTRYELNTLPAEDYPALSSDHEAGAVELTAPAKALVAGIRFVSGAMAIGDVRYYLCGMHIVTGPGSIVLTATNGHALHRARVRLEEHPDLAAFEGIVPGTSVARLVEIASRHAESKLELHAARLTIAGDETLSTKLIDGKFPDADKVIPKSRPVTGGIAREELSAAIKRVTQIHAGSASIAGVRLVCDQEHIDIEATNAEQELGFARIEWAPLAGGFTRYTSGFNWSYLTAALDAFNTDRVNLHLPATGEDSLYITDGDDGTCEAVIMPLRI